MKKKLSPITVVISAVVIAVLLMSYSIFTKEKVSRGSMNGKDLEIPNGYINNFIEYYGKNVWTGEEDKAEYSKKVIKNFSLKFDWSMNSSGYFVTNIDKSMDNEVAGKRMVKVRIESLNKNLLEKPDEFLDNYVNSVLSNNNIMQPKDIKFNYLGFDKRISLNKAMPKFENKEYVSLWNKDIYWEYEGKHVITFIECDNNKISKKLMIRRKCEIRFVDNDILAQVVIYTYRENLIYWKELKESTKKIIHSFIIN